jgi:bacterioferritin (cytochrome b1)
MMNTKLSTTRVIALYRESADIKDEAVFEILQDLLVAEYLQRDVYEAYDYLLLGPEDTVREHIREHLEEEMEHIRVLHRYLVTGNQKPTLERKEIPSIDLSFQEILKVNLDLEKEAINKYISAIKLIEDSEKFTPLKVDLENILVQEQEHAHDIEIWLKNYEEIE